MAGGSVVCAVAVLLVAGWLLRAAQGGWLAPGPLMALYWAVAIAAPPLLAPDYFQSQGAVWYIVLLAAAFSFGSVIASGVRPPARPAVVAPRPLNLRAVRLLVLAGIVAGVAATALVQRANGFPLSSVLSLQGLMTAASSISEARYTNDLQMPALVPVLLAFSYAAALLSPFAARDTRRVKGAAYVLGPVLSASYFAMVTTQRAGMLTAIFLLFAGWVGSHLYFTGAAPAVGFRRVLVAAAAAVGLIAAFLGIALLRIGLTSPQYVRLVRENLSVYLFGYMPGFSHWYDAGTPTFPQAWGSASFAGVAQYVGGSARYGQALTDWAPLGDGGQTNIYSAWRYLIEDFGWAGAPLAAFALGYLITLAWRRLVQRPAPVVLLACLSGYAYMVHSVTLPIFTFTSVVAAFALAGITLTRRVPPPKPVGESPHVIAARKARATAVSSGTAGSSGS